MQYSKSMRFGGQLVEACDCDYQDYKKLGLLCPECNFSVFLVREQTRTRGENEYKVAAHFSHFKQQKEIAVNCELRVSNYSPKDIEKAQNKAKGQRLKFFQKWFWKLIEELPLTEEMRPLSDILAIHYQLYEENKTYKETSDNLYDLVVSKFKDSSVKKYELVDRFIETILKQDFDLSLDSLDPSLETEICIEKILSQLKGKVDLEMHRQICYEALDYALAKRNRPYLTALNFNASCKLANLTGNVDVIKEPKESSIQIYLDNLIQIICFVPWAEKFLEHDN